MNLDESIKPGKSRRTWTVRKFAFVGIVAAVMFLFWAAAKLVLVFALGLGTGGPVNLFAVPMLSVLAARVLDEKGAMVLPAFVFSLLVLPLPGLGPPGFLLKVPILVIPFVVAEPLYLLLKERPGLASTASGALAGFLITFFMRNALVGELGPVLYLLGAVEAGAGGFVGHRIYANIWKRSVIQRIQRPRRA